MFRCGGACDFLITYVENSLVGRRNHMCLTLVCCDRCSSNQCEVDIWCQSGHMVCVVVNPPSLKNLLKRLWDHFGTILVSLWYHLGINLASFRHQFRIIFYSFWYHFGIILEVSVRHRKSTHFGAFQGSGLEPSQQGISLLRSLKCKWCS